MMKKAFTIIELMMVIAIIAVLVTIVVVVAQGAIAQSRAQRAYAVLKVVQQGIDVYYAQKGEWPIQGLESKRPSTSDDSAKYSLSDNEVRQCMKNMLEECRQGNPMFDVSGLFVSRDGKYGLDFMSAIHGTRKTSRKMKVNEMKFGYPKKNGRFEPIEMEYLFFSDQLKVVVPQWVRQSNPE